MKVYLYTANIYESIMDITHNFSQKQIRIYVAEKAIFAFRKQKIAGEEKILVDFFTDNPEDLARDKKFLDEIRHIEQGETNINDKFIAEIELPDSLVNETIAIAKKYAAAKNKFETYAKSLFFQIELIHQTIEQTKNQT